MFSSRKTVALFVCNAVAIGRVALLAKAIIITDRAGSSRSLQGQEEVVTVVRAIEGVVEPEIRVERVAARMVLVAKGHLVEGSLGSSLQFTVPVLLVEEQPPSWTLNQLAHSQLSNASIC